MYKLLLAASLVIGVLCSVAQPPGADRGPGAANEPKFAFWYEDWNSDTWSKLQPANVIIGAPAKAVPEIHSHSGRALAYVTFYQSKFGTAFLHDRSDLQNVAFHTPAGFLPSAFGSKDNFVLCSNSAELSRRVLEYVDRTIERDHFDGFFIDNAYQPPATEETCDAKHEHLVAGAKGAGAYVHLLSLVKDAVHKRNAIIVVNAGNPRVAGTLAINNQTLWDVSDYIVWESYGYSSHVGSPHDRWAATIVQSAALASSTHAKQVLALSYPRDSGEALYSFAVARAFDFAYAANLGEKDFKSEREGGHFGVFLKDAAAELGPPAGKIEYENRSTILIRPFRNGEVVVNSSPEPWSFKVTGSSTLYSPYDKSHVRSGERVYVHPLSAVVLLTR